LRNPGNILCYTLVWTHSFVIDWKFVWHYWFWNSFFIFKWVSIMILYFCNNL